MKIFDTHAHYDDDRYKDDLDFVIKDNKNNGVEKIVNASYSLESSIKSKLLADRYENIYFAIGIHPEEVNNNIDRDILELENILKENINNQKLVAVGEIGLDYYYTKDTKELQKEYFVRQLNLAIKYNLPVIIHSRDASSDMYDILKDEKYKSINIVFHCFQPTDDITKLVLDRNYMVGLGGNITYKRSEHSLKLIQKIPIEKIIAETDAPYMSPIPVRGSRNESKNIKYIIEKIAEIKNIEINVVEQTLYNNSLRFFKINNK